MKRWLLAVSLVASIVLLAFPLAAQTSGKAVLLSINDVYRIEGIHESSTGGLARVRALRAELERRSPELLLLHAGDFLSPSFMGRTYAGAQMVDVMNILDGNPRTGSFDARMFVTFGNHEFDQTHCGKDGPLARLVTASEFTWLSANLDFSRCERLRALVGHKNIATNRIVMSGGLRIGLFGVTLAYPDYAAIVNDPVATACLQVEELRAKGVDAVVAVTHLGWRNDLRILGFGPDGQPLPADAKPCKSSPDVIIGGHDHEKMALPSARPQLFKADADAASAWVIEIEKSGRRPVKVSGRLVQLDEKRVPDAMTQRSVTHWLRQHDERFCLNECTAATGDALRACRAAIDGGACLKETYARATSAIETEEAVNRSFETGFGNWLADQVRLAGGADVAFLNGGSIRINQSLPAGTMLTRRHLEQMFPFKDKLIVREVQGEALWRAMEHAVRERGEGPWAHFSGMAVELSPAQSATRIARILIKRVNGEVVEIGPDSKALFTVASSAFLLSNGDGHGFRSCPQGLSGTRCIEHLESAPQWPLKGDGADISSLVRMRLREADPVRGLGFVVDRRLCDRGQSNCLISRW